VGGHLSGILTRKRPVHPPGSGPKRLGARCELGSVQRESGAFKSSGSFITVRGHRILGSLPGPCTVGKNFSRGAAVSRSWHFWPRESGKGKTSYAKRERAAILLKGGERLPYNNRSRVLPKGNGGNVRRVLSVFEGEGRSGKPSFYPFTNRRENQGGTKEELEKGAQHSGVLGCEINLRWRALGKSKVIEEVIRYKKKQRSTAASGSGKSKSKGAEKGRKGRLKTAPPAKRANGSGGSRVSDHRGSSKTRERKTFVGSPKPWKGMGKNTGVSSRGFRLLGEKDGLGCSLYATAGKEIKKRS